MTLAPGTRLGRYEIRSHIGTGGMGEVYEAIDTELGRTLALQIVSALDAAHRAGIVHRDIKPENIMLRTDGYVKVLDFGLARPTEQHTTSPEASTLVNTEIGTIIGTARYMSPEQARGQKVDGRTDIFSLGVVLYEMVAHKLPFEGSTNSDVVASILKEEPAPLVEYAPDAPLGLQEIV